MRTYIVSPAYCERDGIAEFIDAVRNVAMSNPEFGQWVLTVVDDGSSDQTFEAIVAQMSKADSPCFRLRALSLSRNFGQQAAIQAGLESVYAQGRDGDAVVILDSDLQHPPSLIPTLLLQISCGEDHVQMIREDTGREPWLKRKTSDGFYNLFRHLTGLHLRRGSSDFRAMSWRLLSAYLKLTERGRFNRGLFHWIGFRTVYLTYFCGNRRAGESKYTLARMFRLGLIGLLQFSSRPLVILCSLIVLLSGLLCFLYVVRTAVMYLRGATLVPGWPSLMFLITFWSGTLAMTQLLLAMYIARLFEEVKGRPIYVVKEVREDHE